LSRRLNSAVAGDSDMRIGVTQAEHGLLDLIDEQRRTIVGDGSAAYWLESAEIAASQARSAHKIGQPAACRYHALKAAADLLLAVERMEAGA
jgi:hypothetical protein